MLIPTIEKRLFWLSGGQLYRVTREGLLADAEQQFRACKLPLVVVSREHYKEAYKEYPIVDRKDLSEILRHEFSEYAVKLTTQQNDSVTGVQVLSPTDAVLELLKEKLCVWLPDSLLLGTEAVPQQLEIFEGGSQELFVFRKASRIYSTLKSGAFANPEYFLFAIGADAATPVVRFSEKDMATRLLSGISSLDSTSVLSLLRSQSCRYHIENLTHWPSLLVGSVSAALLFLGLQLGYLNLKAEILTGDIKAQQVAKVLRQQKDLENKVQLLNEIQSSQSSLSSSYPIWSTLTKMMENGITLIFFSIEEQGFSVRAKARSATSALELVRGLDLVKSAEFNSSIGQSRGEQRFTILIHFNQELQP